MLEDVNSILNSGDVPNLYEQVELDLIEKTFKKTITEKGLEITPLNLFSEYLISVKRSIHIVTAMSPMSSEFRT